MYYFYYFIDVVWWCYDNFFFVIYGEIDKIIMFLKNDGIEIFLWIWRKRIVNFSFN